MINTITNTEKALGAETVPERKPSKLYTIKSYRGIIKKLKELEMANKKDLAELERIGNNLLNGYLMDENKPTE